MSEKNNIRKTTTNHLDSFQHLNDDDNDSQVEEDDIV